MRKRILLIATLMLALWSCSTERATPDITIKENFQETYALDSILEVKGMVILKETDSASVCHHFDILGRSVPDDFLSSKFEHILDFNTQAAKNKYCLGMPVYAEGTKDILLTYRCDEQLFMCQYDKRSGSSIQFQYISIGETRIPVRE